MFVYVWLNVCLVPRGPQRPTLACRQSPTAQIIPAPPMRRAPIPVMAESSRNAQRRDVMPHVCR